MMWTFKKVKPLKKNGKPTGYKALYQIFVGISPSEKGR